VIEQPVRGREAVVACNAPSCRGLSCLPIYGTYPSATETGFVLRSHSQSVQLTAGGAPSRQLATTAGTESFDLTGSRTDSLKTDVTARLSGIKFIR